MTADQLFITVGTDHKLQKSDSKDAGLKDLPNLRVSIGGDDSRQSRQVFGRPETNSAKMSSRAGVQRIVSLLKWANSSQSHW